MRMSCFIPTGICDSRVWDNTKYHTSDGSNRNISRPEVRGKVIREIPTVPFDNVNRRPNLESKATELKSSKLWKRIRMNALHSTLQSGPLRKGRGRDKYTSKKKPKERTHKISTSVYRAVVTTAWDELVLDREHTVWLIVLGTFRFETELNP